MIASKAVEYLMLLRIAMIAVLGAFALGQSPQSQYQVGTIMKVVPHRASSGQGAPSNTEPYDISIKVGNTLYTVLYTPPPGVNSTPYTAGLEPMVLVKDDTLVFNSRLTGSTELPILNREELSTNNGLDWSKAPSQYFSLKMQHLTQVLNLSDEQQKSIKPILEQESGELSYLWNNPAISQREKLDRLEKTVQASDQKIIPRLSQEQREKLQALRKEQKEELKQRLKQNQQDTTN
jgi:hypothetical protein